MQVASLPTSEGKRVIRGADDPVMLLADLASEGWQGSRFDVLVEDLWLLGWDVWRGMIRGNRMAEISTGRVPKPHLSAETVEVLQADQGEREAVVLDVLIKAVPAFVDSLRRGTYRADAGGLTENVFHRPLRHRVPHGCRRMG